MLTASITNRLFAGPFVVALNDGTLRTLRVVLTGVVIFCFWSNFSPANAQQGGMANADVVKMVAAGLPEQIIVSAIRSAKVRNFDTSADALIKLKKDNVSDAILAVMLEAPAATAAAPSPFGLAPGIGGPIATRMVASGDPNDPAQPHDTGIYLDKGEGASPRLVPLTSPRRVGQTVGGIWKSAALMGLGGTTANYRVQGPRAETRASANPPVFFFYGIDPEDSPVIEMKKKGNEREYTWLRLGALGSQRGAKSATAVKSEKIADRIYRVVPVAPMKPGEYGFPLDANGAVEFGIDK